MTCRELTELVTDRLEGRLGLLDRLRFALHLGGCRGCRAFLRQVRATLGTLRRLGAPVPPAPAVEAALRRAFAAWAPRAGSASRTDRPPR